MSKSNLDLQKEIQKLKDSNLRLKKRYDSLLEFQKKSVKINVKRQKDFDKYMKKSSDLIYNYRKALSDEKDCLVRFKEHGYFGLVWHKKDILHLRPHLSSTEVSVIIDMIEKRKDATVGVTWDMLEYVIKEFESKKLIKNE